MDSPITMPDDKDAMPEDKDSSMVEPGDGEARIERSLFARKFKIPSIKSDSLRWNREWEKVIHTLSSKDVYSLLSQMWIRREGWDPSEHAQPLKDQVCKLQEMVVKIWDDLEKKGHIVSAWMLLEEGERKRHLLKGTMEACEKASWSQDARALCPEITFSFMLKQGGKAFIEFLREVKKGKTDAGVGVVYALPSEWWGKAVDVSEPSSEEVEFIFGQLTLQRNEFIAQFLLQTVLSVLHDLSYGSPGMDPVIKILQEDAGFASICGDMLSTMRDKPVIRCQNCTKSPEEINGNPKFMMCSGCKVKLNFVVHYCSQECQKKDWRTHKKHCGKQKVSKQLRDTAQDPFWKFPDFPDHLRNISGQDDGLVSINSIGFGTAHPSRPHSPALKRQVSLITADEDADYFLFDDQQRPVRFALHDMWTKMTFRILRSDAMFSADQQGLGVVAAHLIRAMGQKPGLSRERILEQLTAEYGGDVASKVEKFENMGVANGYPPGSSFLEVMSKNMTTTLPHLVGKKV